MKNSKIFTLLKSKKLLTITLGCLLSFSLISCSPSTDDVQTSSASSTDLVINAYGEYDPQVSAQQIIADKMGYFEEEGLTVVNHFMTGPDQNSSLVSNGTAEVCFGSIYNNIAVAANGIDVHVLAPLANAGGTQSLVVGKDVEITSAKDLEGKKIGVTSGAGVMIAINKMCEELDVDIDKITFVNLQASDQLASLEKGDIDGMACWEPWVGKAVDGGGTILFTGIYSNLPENTGDVNWLNFYMTVQVTDEFYTNHPDEAAKFLSALNKATNYINENPKEAAEIISKEINIEADECLRIMNKNVYSMEFNTGFINSCEVMSEFMHDMNNISAIPDTSSYLNSSVLKGIDSSLVIE